MNIYEKVASSSIKLTSSDKKIYEHISSPDFLVIGNYTIMDFSSACGVSNSAITRFVKKFGYENFAQFKLELARYAHSKHAENNEKSEQFVKITNMYINSLNSLKDYLDDKKIIKLCSLLSRYKRIKIVGLEASGYTANFFASRLIKIGIDAHPITEAYMIQSYSMCADENELFIFISTRYQTKLIITVLEAVKGNKAHTVLLTSNDNPINSEFIDDLYVLPTLRTNDNDYFLDSHADYFIFIEILMVYLSGNKFQ